MDKALSDSDIRRGGVNTILYSDLRGMSVDDVLRSLPLAILYQVTPEYGHWTLLMKVPGGVEFFDPYGIIVDAEFDDLEMKQPHYLARMLAELSRGVEVHYNPYAFQRRAVGVSTCGRWAIFRSKFGDWNIDKFKEAVDKVKRKLGVSRDELVVWGIN